MKTFEASKKNYELINIPSIYLSICLSLSIYLTSQGDYDELSFKEGDLIMLISRIGDTDWLRGRLLKGTEGIFPSKYVEIVVSIIIIFKNYYFIQSNEFLHGIGRPSS